MEALLHNLVIRRRRHIVNFMPSEKTKELLDNLKQITKPKRFSTDKVISYTNRFYIENPLHKLPKSYDKAKKYKDEDGEVYIMIDRMYGGVFASDQRLTQKDGTEYKGKIYKKRRLIKNKGNSFYSACSVTKDGRWFDNTGMPIEPPKKVEEDESQQVAEVMKTELTPEEKLSNEQNFLKGLK